MLAPQGHLYRLLPSFAQTHSLNTHCDNQVQQRCPRFDQMIINGYQPGEGITAHVDLLKFDDGIAIVSLAAPAFMTFTKVGHPKKGNSPAVGSTLEGFANASLSLPAQCNAPDLSVDATATSKIQASCSFDVLLEPGDLLLLCGEARYDWKHGIRTQKPDMTQKRLTACRTSLTFRKLIAT